MKNDEEHIVLFDGICNMCNWAVRFIQKRDPNKKFKFASLQSATAKRLLDKYGISTSRLDTVIYISGDHTYLRSIAVFNILKEIGGVWRYFHVLTKLPISILDFFYNMIAKYRYHIFGKRDRCNYLDF
jgi:predicted DCC family thiol-disulfide oxidoreductase YuxK